MDLLSASCGSSCRAPTYRHWGQSLVCWFTVDLKQDDKWEDDDIATILAVEVGVISASEGYPPPTRPQVSSLGTPGRCYEVKIQEALLGAKGPDIIIKQ